MKHRFLTTLALALVAGLTLAPAALRAQSEKLWGLMGHWKMSLSSPGDYAIYNLVVTSGDKLKLSLVSTHSNLGTISLGEKEYLLSVSGKVVTGTLKWQNYYEATDSWRACNAGPTTLPAKGRIAADSKSMVLTYDFPGIDVRKCKWTGKKQEVVYRFVHQ